MAAALLLTGAMTAQVKMNNVLDQMKKELAPDSRTAIWDVRMVGQGGTSVLVGTVGTLQQSAAIEAGLRSRGADYFILGCTELPIVASTLEEEGPFIDPTSELARAAIQFCGYEVKE